MNTGWNSSQPAKSAAAANIAIYILFIIIEIPPLTPFGRNDRGKLEAEIEVQHIVNALHIEVLRIKTIISLHALAVDKTCLLVTSCLHIPVVCDTDTNSYDIPDDLQMLILPGGMPGTTNLANSPEVIDAITRHAQARRLVCAICAAPTVLVSAGVLPSGVHVTCYPSCSVDLDRPCANVPVVVDGNFITGQAPGSAMLFSLVILSTLMGETAASKVARGMVTEVLDA